MCFIGIFLSMFCFFRFCDFDRKVFCRIVITKAWWHSRGTYKVRNEIETKRNETKWTKTKRNETKSTKTKRNETKSTKWKRNKTKPTKAKRNQRKQNEIENGRQNNRGLKEIKPIFTITMLQYFPHMSVFHQERTGCDHHWTRILCIYSAGVCPFLLVASFKFGNHKSIVKSVERRGIKITEVQ